jgi:hypothetical protein
MAKMSPGALDVMNIHDVYAMIYMPAPPSGRAACRSTGWQRFSAIRNVYLRRNIGHNKVFGAQHHILGAGAVEAGTWYLVNTGWIRKMGCLITDFRTAGRGKFKFGGQVGETDYSTAHAG